MSSPSHNGMIIPSLCHYLQYSWNADVSRKSKSDDTKNVSCKDQHEYFPLLNMGKSFDLCLKARYSNMKKSPILTLDFDFFYQNC